MTDRDLTVGMVAPFPFPSDRGSPIRAANFAEIAAESVELHVCTYHIGAGDDTDLPYEMRRIRNLPIEFWEAGASYQKAICDAFLVPAIVKFLWKEDVDVLHGHLHEGCFAAQLARTFLRKDVPIIYDAHGTLVEEMIETGLFGEDSIQRPFWERLEHRIQTGADFVIAQSEPRRQALIADGVEADRTAVIPDIVDTDLFAPQERADDLASELGLPPESPVVAYTGTLQDYQGIPDLIEAFDLLVETHEDARLLFVGGGDLDTYQQSVSDRGLDDYVIFAGPQPFETMPRYLSLADVAVGPRWYGENLPSKLLTYMSAEVATVSTDVPGVARLFEHDENGVVVPQKEPEALARALNALLSDDDRRDRIARAGRKTVVEEYSKAACAARINAIYRKVADEQ